MFLLNLFCIRMYVVKYYYSLQVVLFVAVTVLFSLHNGEFV